MMSDRTLRRRDGVSTVETAIVLGVFLLLVLGMIELGACVFQSHLVADAARAGARKGIVHGEYSSSPWGSAPLGPVNGNDSSPLAQAIMPLLLGVDPQTVTIQAVWLDGDNAVGHRLQVKVTIQHTVVLTSLLGMDSLALSSQTTMEIAH